MKPITIKFLGDVTDLSGKMGQAETKLGKFGTAAAKVGAVAGPALIAVGVAAIKVGTDFDNAKKAIQKATGSTGKDLDGFYQSFKDTMGQVPADMDAVADATGAVATQLGLSGQDLTDFTTLAGKLTTHLGDEMAPNADLAARAMKSYSVDLGGADDFMGDLLKTTEDYGIELPTLLSGMTSMGPALNAVGLEADGAAAFLGEAHSAGIDVSRLKGPLQTFAASAVKAGKDPAVEFANLAEKMRNAGSEEERLAIANEALGASGGAIVAALSAQGIELDQLNGALGDNTGKVDAARAASLTWTEKLEMLRNKALVKLEPILMKIVDGIDGFVTNIGALTAPVIAAALAVADFVRNSDKMAPILGAIGAVAAVVVGSLVPAFIAWSASALAAAASTLLAMAPIVLATLAIAAIGAALVLAYQKFAPFRIAVDAVAKAALVAFNAIKTVVMVTFRVIGATIRGFVSVVVALWTNFGGTLTRATSAAWNFIKAAVNAGINGVRAVIGKIINAIKAKWSATWTAITGATSRAWTSIKAAVVTGINLVKATIFKIMNVVKAKMAAAWAAITGATSAAWASIKAAVQSGANLVKSTVFKIMNVVKAKWSAVWNAMKAKLSDIWNNLKSIVKDGKSSIVTTAKNLVTSLKRAWKFPFIGKVIGNAIDGAMRFFEKMPGRIDGFVGSIKTAADGIGSSIVSGISSGLGKAVGFAGDLASSVLAAVRNVINDNIIDKINSAIPNSIGAGPLSIDLPDNPVPRIATGSSSVAGGTYTVGERGAEKVVLPQGARVVPNHSLASDTPVIVNVTSQADPYEIGQEIAWRMRLVAR